MEQSEKSFPKNFSLDKKALIDFAFQRISPQPSSFADLGGVWGVNGAYTFYTLESYPVKSAFLVDTGFPGAAQGFTETVLQRSQEHRQLQLIHGNFGEQQTMEKLGRVDCLFLFDVLLHQVKPDWDQILEMYAEVSDIFLIFNQQYVRAEKSVRLLDLGLAEYFAITPFPRDHPTSRILMEKMYEINPQHGRIWRDVHNFWQWGITDGDLMGKMTSLGFTLHYFMNCGQVAGLQYFQNHAFLYQRSGKTEA